MNEDRCGDSHFDQTAVLERVCGDTVLLRELVDLFFEDCPKYMADIRAAIERKDALELRRAAHLLRGSVGNFGLSAAFHAAGKLENMGHTGDLTGAEEGYHVLDKSLRQLQVALAALALKPAR